ncbi:MAG: hypothetical protein ABEJ30_03020 [Halorientalis sp.]
MDRFQAGDVTWARDPTGAHEERPVVVLSHENHPFAATDCAVMCAGSSGGHHDHSAPVLEPEHLAGISFAETTHLLPWALYTVPGGVLRTGESVGALTDAGRALLERELVGLLAD